MNLVGGKRFFPNQATWPQSRFYNDFLKPSTSGTYRSSPQTTATTVTTATTDVTTLFTITPLDSSATNFSEMKVIELELFEEAELNIFIQVMSDNSRIVKPNATRNKSVFIPKKIKSPFYAKKSPNFFGNPSILERRKETLPKLVIQPPENQLIETNCKIIFPKNSCGKVELKFETGKCLQLDRKLFSTVEPDLREYFKNNKETQGFAPNKSLKPRKKKKKLLKKKVQVQSSSETPIIFKKRLNFMPSIATTDAMKKFQTILPKPSARELATASRIIYPDSDRTLTRTGGQVDMISSVLTPTSDSDLTVASHESERVLVPSLIDFHTNKETISVTSDEETDDDDVYDVEDYDYGGDNEMVLKCIFHFVMKIFILTG